MTDTRRQALLLALAAARGYLRGLTCPPPLAPPVPPLVGARMAAGGRPALRTTAMMGPGEAARCRTRLVRRDAAAIGWAAAARRWA